LALMVVAGCGRFSFETVDGTTDGGIGDAPCTTGVWSTPQKLPGPESPDLDRGPALSGDQLTLVFESNRGGSDVDLWMMSRATPMAQFTNPRRLTVTSSGSFDGAPTLAADGNTVYFTSEREAPGQFRLSHASRPSSAQAFGISSDALPDVESIGATVADTGELFYGTSTETALFRASSIAQGLMLTELVGGTAVSNPTLSSDGLEIYFVAIRDGNPTRDIYTARRPSVGAPFGPVTKVTALSSNVRDDDPELSRDGRTMLFASTRDGNQFDIFISTRACP
jgi:Tol biopolymer transport system component